MRALTARPARTPELSPFHREFDELLGRFFGDRGEWLPGVRTGRWVPPLESFLRDGQLVVRVDVPGVAPESIDLSVDGDRLTVKGERRSAHEQDKGGRHYREVVYGSFERTMSLPWEVDPDSVKATCKDGVLEITMRAPEKTGARKIAVEH